MILYRDVDNMAVVNLAVIISRNKLAIDDWRQETRTLQRQKQYQAIKNGIKKGIILFLLALKC